MTSCAVARARRAPVLLLQRAAPIDVVGAGRRRRLRSRRPQLRPSPSTSSKSSNRPHLTSAAAPVVAVVAAMPVSVAGPKSTLARPTSAEFSVRRSADAPTAIVSAIDIELPVAPSGGGPCFGLAHAVALPLLTHPSLIIHRQNYCVGNHCHGCVSLYHRRCKCHAVFRKVATKRRLSSMS